MLASERRRISKVKVILELVGARGKEHARTDVKS